MAVYSIDVLSGIGPNFFNEVNIAGLSTEGIWVENGNKVYYDTDITGWGPYSSERVTLGTVIDAHNPLTPYQMSDNDQLIEFIMSESLRLEVIPEQLRDNEDWEPLLNAINTLANGGV